MKKAERHTPSAGAGGILHGAIQELRAEVAAFKEAGADPLTDTLAHWLAAHYAAAAKRAAEDAGDAGLDLQALRGICMDVVALRKGDHSAARLEIEREWLSIEREKSEGRMREQFEEWLQERERIGACAARV